MRPISAYALSSLVTLGSAVSAENTEPADPEQPGHEAELLSNTRQLIFEGRRSGEGYFSADGSKMIFQSEREADNPFYQIYLMDLETGDTQRLSTGTGKTTCAWVHPSGEKVLFASTHEDPQAEQKQREELDKRASGKASRYSWSFDEHYEIYEADTDGTILRRLTEAPGYDAEGSWSPDGGQIAFASNRHAYEKGALSDQERKVLEQDPSVFMDLYIMDSDGGNLRRLTDGLGYDGGPFFSADGSRIVWRRFAPKGHVAEIWTMRTDGSDQRQITRLGVMSWAPYFHPSGDYIVFANNRHGYGNFELYIVDSAGEKEPVRVTDSAGFDGLPVFTPDGKHLSWASGRTPDKKAQIFIADWDDTAARRLLGLGPADSGERMPGSSAKPTAERTTAEITEHDLRLHVTELTSERMSGRMTGGEGAGLATAYVAKAMASIGLAPAGDMGGWFQHYRFTAGVELSDGNRLALKTGTSERPLTLNQDWRPLAFSGSGELKPGELVFAGYGIQAPAEDDFPAYDSYAGLDPSGKWVLVFRYLPENLPQARRQHLHEYAELRFKAMTARDKGAVGLLVISGPSSGVKEQLVPLASETGAGWGSLPVISISDEIGAALLSAAKRDLKSLQAELDRGEPMAGFPLPGIELQGKIALSRGSAADRNVLGRLNAGDGPGDSLVVLGAHVDHIGRGEDMDSRAEDVHAGQVHPGADDNASGVAALLEIAQRLADRKAAGELKLTHDILFAAWTGEELGRLGSAHFAETFAAKAADRGLDPAVLAYLNLDMVGRLDQALYVQGVGSSSVWRREIERRNAPLGLPLRLQEDSYLPTDTTSFYLRGVPVLTLFTGTHADYNTPRDTAERLNYDGLAKIARFAGLMARGLAARPEAPDYIAHDKPKTDASRANLRAYLGTIPDYTESDIRGVALTGVAKGGPADEGGMRAGDIILNVAGKAVENIYDYTYALNALKVGQPVTVEVRREGEALELSITPESRE
jgi:Tol biopolymer transport system component